MSRVVRMPVWPERAIKVSRVSQGRYVAVYDGDQWTERFRTAIGTKFLVMDAVLPYRRGLPILSVDEAQFPLPLGFGMRQPGRFVDDGFTPDWPRPAA